MLSPPPQLAPGLQDGELPAQLPSKVQRLHMRIFVHARLPGLRPPCYSSGARKTPTCAVFLGFRFCECGSNLHESASPPNLVSSSICCVHTFRVPQYWLTRRMFLYGSVIDYFVKGAWACSASVGAHRSMRHFGRCSPAIPYSEADGSFFSPAAGSARPAFTFTLPVLGAVLQTPSSKDSTDTSHISESWT